MTKSPDIPKGNSWNNLILHLHPKQVPEQALKFNLTFGLGGMAALLFVLLVITGMLLRFAYTPTPEMAYNSIQRLQNEMQFGSFVRNIHHWSATLFVFVSFLHMLRVFFTGAYTNKRGSNWVIGICMMLIVIFSNFTGYLLPWDQLAYWAVTVSTNMLTYIPLIGNALNRFILMGSEVGAPTLLFFYNLHTSILPLSIVILMSFHFWKTRKAGGVVIPPQPENKTVKKVSVIPNLIVREFVVAVFLIALILVLAFLFNAPLSSEANPQVTPNPSKAPWYFMGFQELILHFHPVIAIFIIPLSILTIAFYLPKIKGITPVQGIWFSSPKGKRIALLTAIFSFTCCLGFILLNEYLLSHMEFFRNGIFAFSLLVIFITLGFWYLLKININKAESIQTLGVFLLTGFITLTLVGIFLRGEGMHLIF